MEKEQRNEMVKNFCLNFAKLRNAKEAGINVGFSPETALQKGNEILTTKSCKKSLEKVEKSLPEPDTKLCLDGFERLAFGSINDAVRLINADEPLDDKQLMELDLFNICEIKKSKGGGVELKIFDRLKALEKLYETCTQTNVSSAASSFFDAIKEGAKSIDEGGDDS